VDFDIAIFKTRTGPVDVSDIDLTAFERQPLDADTVRCLRYMHDVEFHTICYLRDLLLTPAHRDPDVTAFLTFWCFEEYWHGEAIGAVLARHREAAWQERVGAMRRSLPTVDRLRPFAHLLGSLLVGDDYTAVHMVWGAVNEWCTQAAYARLGERAGHPELSRVLSRVMRQEGRHIDFYASQAEARLGASARARRLARFALRRFWRPVGAGVMPEEETQFVVRHLFGDEDGVAAAQRIDRRVDRFPGLASLHLCERAAAA